MKFLTSVFGYELQTVPVTSIPYRPINGAPILLTDSADDTKMGIMMSNVSTYTYPDSFSISGNGNLKVVELYTGIDVSDETDTQFTTIFHLGFENSDVYLKCKNKVWANLGNNFSKVMEEHFKTRYTTITFRPVNPGLTTKFIITNMPSTITSSSLSGEATALLTISGFTSSTAFIALDTSNYDQYTYGGVTAMTMLDGVSMGFSKYAEETRNIKKIQQIEDTLDSLGSSMTQQFVAR